MELNGNNIIGVCRFLRETSLYLNCLSLHHSKQMLLRIGSRAYRVGFAFLHKPVARPSEVISDTFQICFTAETPFLTFIPFLLQILPQTALLRRLPPLEGSESHLFQLLLALSVTTDFFERVLLTCVHRQLK